MMDYDIERLVANTVSLLRRTTIAQLNSTNTRDLDTDCSYPTSISSQDYSDMYKRNGIAKRVVDLLPNECWSEKPTVSDNNESGTDSEFDLKWLEFENKLHVSSYFTRIDKLSGIGRFGLLLMGFDDGKEMIEPVEFSGSLNLIYLRAFEETVISIKKSDDNPTSERFGMPVLYTANYIDSSGESFATDVHWTRVIHVAEGREMSEIYGTPRLESVYNYMLDLKKLLGSSAEMFYRGGFPGILFEIDPSLVPSGELTDDQITGFRTEMDNYSNTLQRYAAFVGMKGKSMAPAIADVKNHIMAQMDAIAMAIGVPKRILFGTEAAHLSSSQDTETWNKRLAKRQNDYITPYIIRVFVDRMQELGILPAVDYSVTWSDLNTTSDISRADVAEKQTKALSMYVAADIEGIMEFSDYLGLVLGFDADQVEQIVKNRTTTMLDEGDEDDRNDES